jgi:hypothetical protein
MEDRDLEQQIMSRIARYAGWPVHKLTPESRLRHDLKIGGDDFAELIDELHRALGVTLAGQLKDYCPAEVEALWAHWSPFKRPQHYRELPISELVRSARLKVMVG